VHRDSIWAAVDVVAVVGCVAWLILAPSVWIVGLTLVWGALARRQILLAWRTHKPTEPPRI
jgi:hypothetical protein